MSTIELKLPQELNDIKLREYQEYAAVLNQFDLEKDADMISQKSIAIFCDVPMHNVVKTPLVKFDNLLMHLNDILSTKASPQYKFEMTGSNGVTVKFGLMPDLHNMSYAEWKDLEMYMANGWTDMHKALAVLYRPITFEAKNGMYRIEDYESAKKYAEVMKDTPLEVALGVEVFFCHLGTRLQVSTISSTLQEIKEQSLTDTKRTLVESGENINRSYLSLTETLMKLKERQRFHYTSH